ncbi:MAG: nicotinate (nicotinamide) nucleotide adenylyltransferase [Sedimentisphaerales bacterium]|nr:nicotinate (nicotinamide) nucleotide adenylyltransferase [Sedimentisphaerales bacterium]
MSERIVLFGGTFDPVHLGHITVAQVSADKIGASKVVLIPARRSPHKKQKPVAADNHRIAMLKLAIAGKNLFQISLVELNRAEPSYTVDTIDHLARQFGSDCRFYWLIGIDMLEDLYRWHKINELFYKCTICLMYRGGYDRPDFNSLSQKLDDSNIEKLKTNMIETPLINISSTQIRQGISKNQDICQHLHPDVLDYIKRHRLYAATD